MFLLEVSRMGDTFLSDMGKRIQERRKSLRISQEELAERAEITKQTVSRAENGQRELGAGNVLSIANALGVSTDYLLKGEYGTSDVLLLNQRAADLTSRQFNYLEDMVKKFIDMCDEGII